MINLNEVITGLDGKPIKMDKTEKDMTVKDIFVTVLTNFDPKKEQSGEEKFKNAMLAQKIYELYV